MLLPRQGLCQGGYGSLRLMSAWWFSATAWLQLQGKLSTPFPAAATACCCPDPGCRITRGETRQGGKRPDQVGCHVRSAFFYFPFDCSSAVRARSNAPNGNFGAILLMVIRLKGYTKEFATVDAPKRPMLSPGTAPTTFSHTQNTSCTFAYPFQN